MATTSLLTSPVEDFAELEWLHPWLDKFSHYQPNFPFEIETSKYVLKTADKIWELAQVFKLRYDCFLATPTSHLQANHEQIDVDEFDPVCDHIIIIDKASGEVCGTYRVLSSLLGRSFYSETEFVLDQFISTKSLKLELGRAAIHEAHRNGQVLSLLWKGIGTLAQLSGAQQLFGCSSVKSTDQHLAHGLYHFFKRSGVLVNEKNIYPTAEFSFACNFENKTEKLYSDQYFNAVIPPLLKSYVSAGAKIFGPPALDEAFHCMDFFTVMDLNQISDAFKRRYFH